MAFSPIRYDLTPAIGGIGGPVPGFENVKSDLFAKTLTENEQLAYAAAAKLAQTGLSGTALAQRQAIAEEGALDRLKLTQEQAKKNQKLKLIQGLLSDGGNSGGMGAVDPMLELLAANKTSRALDSLRNKRLAGNNELANALLVAIKEKSKGSGGADLSGLATGLSSTQLKPESLNALDMDMIKEFVKHRKASK